MNLINLIECSNTLSKFTLNNGKTVKGIVFFFHECPTYKFLPGEYMKKFTRYSREGDEENMRKLCREITLDEIVNAECLNPKIAA